MTEEIKTQWIQEFEKRILHRQHIVLYGNIYDYFFWRGGYQNIKEIIESYFLDLKFEIVVYYEPIEKGISKWKFAQPEMTDKITSLVGKSRQSYDPDSDSDFVKMRCLLSQSVGASVVTVNLDDASNTKNLISSHDLMILKKCTLEAGLIYSDSLKVYRNTLIILASQLKDVPESFYRNNPFVSLLQIPLPNKDERYQFGKTFILSSGKVRSGFYQTDSIQKESCKPGHLSELEILAEELADNTDGFKIWDLETLRYTSWEKKFPLQVNKVSQLVDYYKFGERKDPWEQLSKDKVKKASEELSRAVIGQENAIKQVTEMLVSARVGLKIGNNSRFVGQPKGIFFFVGPTGVGKTELAKAMTKLVFGSEEAFFRFDMSEYKDENADQKLIGAPPGYKGYGDGGQLTNLVIQKPYSILLFDEIEKAHPRILDKFLQILEDGRLTDSKGQTAYFNQTVIIFTSNIGASNQGNRLGIMSKLQEGKELTYEEVNNHFQTEVSWFFSDYIGRAELLGRLGGNIVVFDLLRSQNISLIGEKLLRQFQAVSLDKYQLNILFQPSIYEDLNQKMVGQNLLLGGRQIKKVLEKSVEIPLNNWIFYNFDDMNQLVGITLELSIIDGSLKVHQL